MGLIWDWQEDVRAWRRERLKEYQPRWAEPLRWGRWGFVRGIYMLTAGDGIFKVGMSVNVLERYKTHVYNESLRHGQLYPLELIHVVRVGENVDLRDAERFFHSRFQRGHMTEWFPLTPVEVAWFCVIDTWTPDFDPPQTGG